MADVSQTIANQLKDLIDTKNDITAAINESAAGTTQEIGIVDFAQYGDIIRAIFSVQDITKDCDSLGSLFTLGKLTCYYVDIPALGGNVAVTDAPVNSALWLFSMALTRDNNGVKELDNVAQLVINRTSLSELSRMHIRHSSEVDKTNNIVTSWSEWIEYAPQSVIEASILGGGEGNNIVFAASGSTAPTGASTAGQIYVDTATQNIYIYDGQKWQLMNAWQ